MKILQVNTTLNTGSTGRIAEGIGQVAMAAGYESYAGYSVLGAGGTQSCGIKIGGKLDTHLHGVKTRVLDLHGFGSARATKNFIQQVEAIDPDIIGLHNLHGYYLNIEVLFRYLKKTQKPVVWTFHDCWPFTGHCTHFMRVGCEKWKVHCCDCPLTGAYPASWYRDRSYNNFEDKRQLFNGLSNLNIITPSRWLQELVNQSFLSDYPVKVIYNGIDTNTFSPKNELSEKNIVLGVAGTWTEWKGLFDFIQLREKLPETMDIVLIGLTKKQKEQLPRGITGIERTENVEELAAWYSKASVFLNPTYSDNFPTTNIEALACGTPVITYNTGGSPEAVDEQTGFVVEQGELNEVVDSILEISQNGREMYREPCRKRALANFNKDDRFQEYVELYESMLR